MATLLNNTITTSTLVGSQNLVYSGSIGNTTTLSIGGDLTDFFELVLAALGYDITYDDFKKMSKEQRNQIIRDIKLKTII
jgi:uncharacterized protein YmfQ (DUF2313 family)